MMTKPLPISVIHTEKAVLQLYLSVTYYRENGTESNIMLKWKRSPR